MSCRMYRGGLVCPSGDCVGCDMVRADERAKVLREVVAMVRERRGDHVCIQHHVGCVTCAQWVTCSAIETAVAELTTAVNSGLPQGDK